MFDDYDLDVAFIMTVFGGLAIAGTHYFGAGSAATGLAAAVVSRLLTWRRKRRGEPY